MKREVYLKMGKQKFQFTVIYVKLNDKGEFVNSFTRNILIDSICYEYARNQALEQAQSLLRELESPHWFMRVCNG